MDICAREGCEEPFDRKTHNQRYHNDECCRLATNARIMQKYYAKRDRRAGKARYCQECGVTRLNRYNDSSMCSSCQSKKQTESKNSVLDLLFNSSIVA